MEEEGREGSMAERPDREDGLSAGELGGETDPRDESEQQESTEQESTEHAAEEHEEETQEQIGEAMDSGEASEGGGDGGAAGGKSRHEMLEDEGEESQHQARAEGNGQAAGSNE